jgi:hypothetical protein
MEQFLVLHIYRSDKSQVLSYINQELLIFFKYFNNIEQDLF